MVNIFFQASGLMHVIVTAIIYFTKVKEKTIENYVYRSLILCSIITLVLPELPVIKILLFLLRTSCPADILKQ